MYELIRYGWGRFGVSHTMQTRTGPKVYDLYQVRGWLRHNMPSRDTAIEPLVRLWMDTEEWANNIVDHGPKDGFPDVRMLLPWCDREPTLLYIWATSVQTALTLTRRSLNKQENWTFGRFVPNDFFDSSPEDVMEYLQAEAQLKTGVQPKPTAQSRPEAKRPSTVTIPRSPPVHQPDALPPGCGQSLDDLQRRAAETGSIRTARCFHIEDSIYADAGEQDLYEMFSQDVQPPSILDEERTFEEEDCVGPSSTRPSFPRWDEHQQDYLYSYCLEDGQLVGDLGRRR